MIYEEFLKHYSPELQILDLLDALEKGVISLEEMEDLMASVSKDEKNI